MIVQCPSCSKRYRVNDANIPPSGGKIRCPQCSHSFVVYPKSGQDSQDAQEVGEKTQVAQRPSMEQLLKGMRQSGGVGGGQEEEAEAAATEVMSGADLPDFNNLFGGMDGGDDATMEVPNPLHPSNLRGQGSAPGDDLETQELDADIAKRSIEHVKNLADSSPPLEGFDEGDEVETQITPPSQLGDIPAPPDRMRASVPGGPTPPPGQNPAPGAGSGSGHGGAGANPAGSSSPGAAPMSGGSSPGVDAASPPPGVPSDAGGPDASHDGPWKLKTNFGLTYEFADNDSLREWLDGRDELDGYELSADGDDFYPLEKFPQVQGPKAQGANGRGRQMPSSGGHAPMPGRSSSVPGASSPQSSPPQPASSGAGRATSSPGEPGRLPSTPGGMGPAPPLGGGAGHSPFQTAAKPAVGAGAGAAATPEQPEQKKEKINPDEMFKPPTRDSKALNIVLWGAFLMLMAAAVVLLLDLFDVIDIPLFSDDAEDTEVVAQEEEPEEEEEAVAQEEEPEEEELDDDALVDLLLEEAQEDIDENRLGPALEQLEEAAQLDADRVEIYELKALVYEEFGDGDEAEAMREQAEQLRAEQEDDGEEVPGEEEDG